MTRAVALLLLFSPLLGGCSFIPAYSYVNLESGEPTLDLPRPVENVYRTVSLRPLRPETVTPGTRKASLQTVPWYVTPACRTATFGGSGIPPSGPCHDDNFVALSISGGGSRAAIFGAAVMFELERYGLLDDVDLLSCVSGGCLTAGYYALSCDDRNDASTCPPTTNGAQRYAWRESELYPLLERRLLWHWFGNWFWPDNILKFWFTHFDRTDIMAETLSNNLYDRSLLDNNQFRFRDLNPARPNLAINATRVVADTAGHYHFAFTPETFAAARSNLDQYPIANAVMASAAFPGAFNYVTLRDFRAGNYIHLLDGGAYDNLGLNAIRIAMEARDNHGPGDKPPADRIVILVDAYMALANDLSQEAEVRS
jgi:predicted acylesterase/phospholipase RssA